MNRLLKDLAIDRAKNPTSALNDRWDSEDEEDVDDEGDINIIDRCKSAFLMHSLPVLTHFAPFILMISLAEERGPGGFVDVTRARRHEMEDIHWPRPGWEFA